MKNKCKDVIVISGLIGMTFGFYAGGLLFSNRLDEIQKDNLRLTKENLALDRANQVILQELRGECDEN